MTNPLVSVIMPVFNAQHTITEAVNSILGQGYNNFEFLIFNDASTDSTVSILRKFKDKRIKVFTNNTNLRVSACMNKGFDVAKGKYIVRMDADDISLPERLQLQVDFMESHPGVGVCGGWMSLIGDMEGKIWKTPTNPKRVKTDLLFYNTIMQPSVILRRSFFNKYKLRYNSYYDQYEQKCEDYSLWIKCVKLFDCTNLDHVLVKYRVSRSKIIHDLKHVTFPEQIRKILLLELMPDHKEFKIHEQIATGKVTLSNLGNYENWLSKLIIENSHKNLYDETALRECIAKQWTLIGTHHLKNISPFTTFKLINSPLIKHLSFSSRFKFTKQILNRLLSYYKQSVIE